MTCPFYGDPEAMRYMCARCYRAIEACDGEEDDFNEIEGEAEKETKKGGDDGKSRKV